MGLDEAIQEAGETRFGSHYSHYPYGDRGPDTPCAESNPLYSPLALVIIGGLLSSTILTPRGDSGAVQLLAPRIDPEGSVDR